MKLWRAIVMVGVVLAMAALAPVNANAASYGSSYKYKLIGFAADSKHVYFERHDSEMEDSSTWLRVVNVKTGKLVRAVRVEYECGFDTCVSKKQGAKIRAKLYATYGEPQLVAKSGDSDMKATWKFGDALVETELAQLGKLPDPMEFSGEGIRFDLSRRVKGKAEWKGAKKLWAPTIDDDFNGNIQEWPELYLQELALSPDHTSVAVVFGRKPFVVRRLTAEDIAEAKAKSERRAKRRARRKARGK
jgi:hypothetical protein